MALTYKFKSRKIRNTNRFGFVKWFLVVSIVFVLGISAGYWASLMFLELGNEKDSQQLAEAEESLRLYKTRSTILQGIVELNEAFQRATHASTPPKPEEIQRLRSRLGSLKNDFEAVEATMAELENREKIKIGYDFVLPEGSRTQGEHEEYGSSLVKGKIVDLSGLPLEGVEVRLQNSYSGISDKDGVYLIRGVQNGHYFIQSISGSEESSPRRVLINKTVEPMDDIIFPQPVREMFFCKAITKRASSGGGTTLDITGQGDEFQADVGKLFCYTHIMGARRHTVIKHRWYWNDAFESEVALPVKSNDWRTYSAKQISPEKTGKWRVDVVKADDNLVLASRTFNIR